MFAVAVACCCLLLFAAVFAVVVVVVVAVVVIVVVGVAAAIVVPWTMQLFRLIELLCTLLKKYHALTAAPTSINSTNRKQSCNHGNPRRCVRACVCVHAHT